jgi:SAM-dependent methyltransferase
MYSEDYFSHSKYLDIDTQAEENRRRLDLVRAFIPESGKECRILDFGCGCGDFIKYCSGVYEMWGYDFSESAVLKARENNPGISQRIGGNLTGDKGWSANSFDAVVMWDVLEHLWDPAETCARLSEYVKPGGYLFSSTPDIGAFIARLTGKYWAFMTPPEHLGFFSAKSTEYLFEDKMDFRIITRESRGKKVNIGFLLYKLRRILPGLVPEVLIRFFQRPSTRRLSVYVPTMDIQYVVARKPGLTKNG